MAETRGGDGNGRPGGFRFSGFGAALEAWGWYWPVIVLVACVVLANLAVLTVVWAGQREIQAEHRSITRWVHTLVWINTLPPAHRPGIRPPEGLEEVLLDPGEAVHYQPRAR